jgi:O-antigen ligase
VGIQEIPLQIDKYLLFRTEDSDVGAVGGFNVSVAMICFGLLYLVWVMKGAASRCLRGGKWVFGWPMLAYLVAVVISFAGAAEKMLAYHELFLLLQAYAMFFYLANRIRQRSDIEFCLLSLALALVVQAFLIFGLAAMGERAYGERFDIGPLALVVWEDGRVGGSMHSPVVAGSMMAFLWMPVMAYAISNRSVRRVGWFMFAAIVFGLLGIFLTQTRGALVTMFAGCVWFGGSMFWRNWLPKWTIYGVLLLSIISIAPLAMIFEKRIRRGDGGSAESRIHLSAIAMQMLADRPVFGFGAGNYHLASLPYANQGSYRSEWFFTVHCKYLLVWAETGVLGLIVFLVMLGAVVRDGVRAWRTSDPVLAPVGLAIAAGVIGHMVHMFVDIFNSRSLVQLLWVMIGIAAAIYQTARVSQDHRSCGSIDVA